MIDHAEAREMIELAAVQPGGLDRLAAGDTADSVTLAGHLAGCPSCLAEADRLRAAAGLIRAAVLETPPPELRERTLALVRAVGRTRSAAGSPGAEPAAIEPTPIARRSRFRSIALPLGIAAAIVLASAGTAAIILPRQDAALAASQATSDELARVTNWALQVEAQPDVQRIVLTGPPGSAATGTVLYSPASTALVVVASGLASAPAGQEYRCWVLLNGTRREVGRMDLGGGLAYWVGPAGGLPVLPPGTQFGVSLAAINGALAPGDPVIGGTVGG